MEGQQGCIPSRKNYRKSVCSQVPCRRDRRAAHHPPDNGANSGSDRRSDNSRDDRRSETRHTAYHPGSQAIPDGSAVASHRRRSVSDRSPGKISVSSRSCRVGKSPFEDLSLCRSQELRDDQSRRLHVREGGNCTGLPRFQNREAPERKPWLPYFTAVPQLARTCRLGLTMTAWTTKAETYVSLRCPACARVHLVNRAGETPVNTH
jgi:hypothetical protein